MSIWVEMEERMERVWEEEEPLPVLVLEEPPPPDDGEDGLPFGLLLLLFPSFF